MTSTLVRMSPADFAAFQAAIAAPAAPVPEMVEFLRRVPPWGRSGDEEAETKR